nr:MAG TPA: hypothetical protein [Caudoviricetes sp.]
MSLYGTYKNTYLRKVHRESKQFKLEQHIDNHPTDYQSIIANEKLKSEIYWLEYKLKEVERKMEIDG